MAKKRAKKTGAKKTRARKTRKAARSRSAAGKKAAGPKGVDTSAAIAAMEKVLTELKDAKRAGGWNLIDKAQFTDAELGLKLMMFKLKCPPGSATQSFPG